MSLTFSFFLFLHFLSASRFFSLLILSFSSSGRSLVARLQLSIRARSLSVKELASEPWSEGEGEEGRVW